MGFQRSQAGVSLTGNKSDYGPKNVRCVFRSLKREEPMSGVKAFAWGLGIGFVTSMFVAPQSGKQTRRTIGRKAREVRDFVGDTAESLAETVQDVRAQMNDAMTGARDNFSSTIEDAKGRIQEAVETGKKVYREQLSRGVGGAGA